VLGLTFEGLIEISVSQGGLETVLQELAVGFELETIGERGARSVEVGGGEGARIPDRGNEIFDVIFEICQTDGVLTVGKFLIDAEVPTD